VLGSTGNPHIMQSKNSFPPYGLPPNYTPPNAVHVTGENINHSALVLLESQQPQLGHAPFAQPMGEAREEPQDHALGEFEPYPKYAAEGPAFGGMPQPNTSHTPQHSSL